MKLYHYCAMRQGSQPGALNYSSGTISSNYDLSKPDQYKQLQQGITEKMNESQLGSNAVVILSLTLIGDVL